MKSILISVCTAGSLAFAALPVELDSSPGKALESHALIAASKPPGEGRRIELVRSRSAYEVHGLTAPVDRSLEVLDGDAFAWRRRKSRLA